MVKKNNFSERDVRGALSSKNESRGRWKEIHKNVFMKPAHGMSMTSWLQVEIEKDRVGKERERESEDCVREIK